MRTIGKQRKPRTKIAKQNGPSTNDETNKEGKEDESWKKRIKNHQECKCKFVKLYDHLIFCQIAYILSWLFRVVLKYVITRIIGGRSK